MILLASTNTKKVTKKSPKKSQVKKPKLDLNVIATIILAITAIVIVVLVVRSLWPQKETVIESKLEELTHLSYDTLEDFIEGKTTLPNITYIYFYNRDYSVCVGCEELEQILISASNNVSNTSKPGYGFYAYDIYGDTQADIIFKEEFSALNTVPMLVIINGDDYQFIQSSGIRNAIIELNLELNA